MTTPGGSRAGEGVARPGVATGVEEENDEGADEEAEVKGTAFERDKTAEDEVAVPSEADDGMPDRDCG